MTAFKYAYYVPVSIELIVDSLPMTTLGMSDGHKAAEYLQYGQPVALGPYDDNPARIAEEPERALWDFGWPMYLDNYDEECW